MQFRFRLNHGCQFSTVTYEAPTLACAIVLARADSPNAWQGFDPATGRKLWDASADMRDAYNMARATRNRAGLGPLTNSQRAIIFGSK